jgi:hypothetical protein
VTAERAGRLAALLAGCLLTAGCGAASTGAAGAGWLSAEPEEQRAQLERHLRGLDVAMVETGYRYGELYWAGRDGNWQAAAYHVAKMRLAIENALERRPKRAASAKPFLEGPLAAVAAAVDARDPGAFAERFDALTRSCNECHAREDVAFFEVRPPALRASPVAPVPAGR